MDVKITITCDENALEFSRNLQGFYMNLVSGEVPKRIGKTARVSENEEKLKAMENEKGERPWEQKDTENTEDTKKALAEIEEGPKAWEDPKPDTSSTPKPAPTAIEIRQRAEAYARKHGNKALKEVLNKYGLAKISVPEAKEHYSDLWKDLEV